jgi:hypothetical protein
MSSYRCTEPSPTKPVGGGVVSAACLPEGAEVFYISGMVGREQRWIIRLITRDGAWVGTMWHAGDANGTARTLEPHPWQAHQFDDFTNAEGMARRFRQNSAADKVDVIEWQESLHSLAASLPIKPVDVVGAADLD